MELRDAKVVLLFKLHQDKLRENIGCFCQRLVRVFDRVPVANSHLRDEAPGSLEGPKCFETKVESQKWHSLVKIMLDVKLSKTTD
mmetsp:Transcript_25672/g.41346  ORF Transcript_25672/g.41346 Transcript_25672/m.41346 type:complete len:85 (+) Transcript_25672:41-295(+)